jgi:signal transduction histidine kinase
VTSRHFPLTRRISLPTGSDAQLAAPLYDSVVMSASAVSRVVARDAGRESAHLERDDADSNEAGGFLVKPHPRRALGITVVVGVMLLQLTTEFVAGREGARILARLAFMALELPLLMVALSAAFAWSIRRRMTAAQALATGSTIATGIGCVFGLLYGALSIRVPALRHFPNGVSFVRPAFFGILSAQLYFGVWALAFVYPFAVESSRVRALEAQQLRSRAEVARLRAHLEPHFLLNTLNAIAGLVTEEPREARRLLACLGDLLRDAVQDASELQPLSKQIAWLRRYADILEARHRGVLRFRWDVAPGSGAAMLPRFLLQPLVENAVKHGALRRGDGAGEVVVHASTRDDGTLVCIVEDNGPGMPDADVRAGAFGLHAVRRRLELETPLQSSLRLESSSEGTRSIVEIARFPEGA